jgi:hypothetical protein
MQPFQKVTWPDTLWLFRNSLFVRRCCPRALPESFVLGKLIAIVRLIPRLPNHVLTVVLGTDMQPFRKAPWPYALWLIPFLYHLHMGCLRERESLQPCFLVVTELSPSKSRVYICSGSTECRMLLRSREWLCLPFQKFCGLLCKVGNCARVMAATPLCALISHVLANTVLFNSLRCGL